MRMPINMSMVNMLERLNMESSRALHWCVPPLVIWVGRPLCFTRGLLIYLPHTGDNHTAQPSTGYDVICPLPCFDQLFCAYVRMEPGLLWTILSRGYWTCLWSLWRAGSLTNFTWHTVYIMCLVTIFYTYLINLLLCFLCSLMIGEIFNWLDCKWWHPF